MKLTEARRLFLGLPSSSWEMQMKMIDMGFMRISSAIGYEYCMFIIPVKCMRGIGSDKET